MNLKPAFLIFLFANLIPYTFRAQCTTSGSNLIPNPSFESSTAQCTGTDNQLYTNQTPVQSWYGTQVSGSVNATPDYINPTTTSGSGTCGSSTNAANATCITGSMRVGIFVLGAGYPGANSREYIQAQLNSTLVAGDSYCFSMEVRSKYGAAGNVLLNSDGIGAYFHNLGVININTSNGGQQYLGPGSTINATPQVEQAAGTVITNACTVVTGTFTAAGTENYVTIGNFRNDASTTTSGSSSVSYMYIDNLLLYDVTTVLPIELVQFSAKCAGNTQMTLNWSTATEINNKEFIIEKSLDGVDYTKVGVVPGSGNSTITKYYSFKDEVKEEAVNNPIFYYRLKQVDFNGTSSSPKIIEVQPCNSHQIDIVISPNPSNGKFNILNPSGIQIKYELYTSLGQIALSGETAEVLTTLDLTEVAGEVYFLRVQSDNETKNFKLLKQNNP